ncbi:MAG: hypothetical protein GX539_08840 [Candidatus Cloacimonetes bacterium]|nr:hypothetical protein [Candidatus Cloacimonadota bacterium]
MMTKLLLAVAVLLLSACTSNGGPPAESVDPALEALVDSLIPGLERLSGLERREPLRMAMQSRDEARAYIERQLDKELPPERIDAIRKSYAALGLMADTLDLRSLLLELYTEQVIGYYDPETDRLYVIEGVDRELLRPVLVHELVHALQDQHVNLDSLIASDAGVDEVVLGSNDRQTAAQAAIEGHATLVMLAFLAEQMSGRQIDPLALPNPAMQLGSSMQAQNSQFPVFRRAPAIIRETMIFPYVSGAGFVHTVWTARGAPTFTDLIPTSTEQVLHPQERYVEAVDEPTTLALAVPEGWQPVYGNVLGEYETRIWLREHLGVSASRASQGWDGDAFHLLASAQGDTVLVWWSVWDDEEAARRFADAAARVPANGGAMQVRRATVGGMPAVSVTRRVSGAEVPPELPPRIVE